MKSICAKILVAALLFASSEAAIMPFKNSVAASKANVLNAHAKPVKPQKA